jgi:hypothetical protein
MKKNKTESKTKWTHFMDMHSGGGQKEKYAHIYIEAPEDEAKIVFYNRFGHNPERVTCTCCGGDYSISEYPSLKQATAYNRGCTAMETPTGKDGRYKEPSDPWFKEHYYLEGEKEIKEAVKRGYSVSSCSMRGEYQSLEAALKSGKFENEFCSDGAFKVIYSKDIKPKGREGDLPEQGYVWKD